MGGSSSSSCIVDIPQLLKSIVTVLFCVPWRIRKCLVLHIYIFGYESPPTADQAARL